MSNTFSFQIISKEALFYNSSTRAFELIPDYDPNLHNLVVTVTDDDDVMHNMSDNDGTAIDANQTAVVTNMNGDVIAKGMVYSPAYASVSDNSGGNIYLDRIEVEGEQLGYSTSETLAPGESYKVTYSGPYEDTHKYYLNNGVEEGKVQQSNELPDPKPVPCFVSGTMLLTRDGMKPVDWITVGDDLWTQDHGWQTVRWRGVRQFSDSADFTHPIEITPGALGTGTPAKVLRVSPQHRIRVSGRICKLWFGEDEVLVAAKHFLGRPGVAEVTLDTDHAYHHLLFDRHEVLTSDGIALESLFLGDQIPHLHPAPLLAMTHTLAEGHAQAARRCLTASEARILQESIFSPALILPEEAPDHAATGAVSAAIA